jgi:hypothetical protein
MSEMAKMMSTAESITNTSRCFYPSDSLSSTSKATNIELSSLFWTKSLAEVVVNNDSHMISEFVSSLQNVTLPEANPTWGFPRMDMFDFLLDSGYFSTVQSYVSTASYPVFWRSSEAPDVDSLISSIVSTVEDKVEKLKKNIAFLTKSVSAVIFKLTHSSWDVDNPYLLFQFLGSLKTVKTKLVALTISNRTDKKADSKSHFHGVRLPPPVERKQHERHLTLGRWKCLVANGGVDCDMPNTKPIDTIEIGEVKWRKLRNRSRSALEFGKMLVQLSEKERRSFTKKSTKPSEITPLWSRKLQISCAEFVLWRLKQDILRLLATYLSSQLVSLRLKTKTANLRKVETSIELKGQVEYD